MRIPLLKYLSCPYCGGELLCKTEDEATPHIMRGQLFCPGCGMSIPIIRGVPRFIFSDTYAASFGAEWKKFNKTKSDAFVASEFATMLALSPSDMSGKTVLDAGCGAGNYSRFAVEKWNAETVVGVDLSTAVDAAFENTRHLQNVLIIQADINALPMKKGLFDTVFSIGVIHHTPDTKASFCKIAEQVKKNGIMAIWIYGAYWLRKTNNLDFLRKNFTSRMNPKVLMLLAHAAAYIYYLYKIPLIGTALRETIPIAMDNEHSIRVLNNFDLYSPAFVNRHTIDELFHWFFATGFSDMEPSRYLVGMKGRKR
ncbi:MAG: methyltransferase domain-containing protein [Candidatus Ozemobacteraceae bacterium]